MKALQVGRRFLGAAVDVIMPPMCLSCGARTAQPRSLCGACWSQLAFIEDPHCPVWGEPFAFDAGPDVLSARAIATPPPWTTLTAAVALNDRASHLVHALKYHDRLEAARFMAGLMHRAAKDTLMQSDALIPVPLHWLRLWRRRSNQAALLALTLGRLCGKQPLAQGLIRGRPTPSQVGLNQKERQENMRGAFAVAGAAHMAIAGKRVALIDDVVTTGATAGAAAEALLKAGARQVDVVVFALVLLPGQDHI